MNLNSFRHVISETLAMGPPERCPTCLLGLEEFTIEPLTPDLRAHTRFRV